MTDMNGCTATSSAVLAEADMIENDTVVTPATGAMNADGSIMVTATTGGSPPYSYLWDTGETTANITNLLPGEYSLTVTDADSCQQAFVYSVDVGTAAGERFGEGVFAVLSPNPVARGAECFLMVKGDLAGAEMRLTDARGQILWTRELSLLFGEAGTEIPVPETAGVYFLVLENGEGERSALRMVVL